MGYFIGKLNLEQDGSKYWKTTKELIYVTTLENRITIPVGFETDGASIPRALWSVIGHPFNGKHVRAATLHDYLYRTQKFSKAKCDKLFLEAMDADDVSWLRRHLMYWGVKFFGSAAYKG